MRVYPLHPHAALLVELTRENDDGVRTGSKYIVVSDLHIGFEAQLDELGVTIKSSAVDEMLDELLKIISKRRADGLILLGDIKSSISSISKQEWDEIPNFLRILASKVATLYIVPGNHDGNISRLVPKDVENITAISAKGMLLEDTLLVHGHSMPSEIRASIKRIVMGHVHPVFLKKDSVLGGHRVWVHVRVRKESLFSEKGVIDVVVVPSFNRYLYATDAKHYHKSISPILTRALNNNFVEEALVISLDGAVLARGIDAIESVL